MARYIILLAVFILCTSVSIFHTSKIDTWGFFGHRRINRMAVFTLPQEMFGFYKKNIDFITEHAVDPDKRRYATKHEAVRHYIDIDLYGKAPFNNLPRTWTEALMAWTDLKVVTTQQDTIDIFTSTPPKQAIGADPESIYKINYLIKKDAYFEHQPFKKFFVENVLNNYYNDTWTISCQTFNDKLGLDLPLCQEIIVSDHLSHNGIIPWHLYSVQKKLTKAFQDRDTKNILRQSAEIGHYIGDAHVPLHTTVNYNGQLTDQLGIHAFWESRIPELFADDTYDFFVGKSQYIDTPKSYYWDIILTSHSYLDSVLLIEKKVSQQLPSDLLYCYDERLGRTTRVPCREFALAYQSAMNGLVEKRMRDAILALGNIWYTCWVDAGSPNLSQLNLTDAQRIRNQSNRDELNQKATQNPIIGRPHQ